MKSDMAGEYVSTHIAAKLLSLRPRTVRLMCERRVLKTAFKPGIGEQAQWRILRTEIIERKINGHAQPYQ